MGMVGCLIPASSELFMPPHWLSGLALALALTLPAWADEREAGFALAVSQAQALLRPGQSAALQAKASPLDTFASRGTAWTDSARPDGSRYLHFDRLHQGVPVWGGEVIVQLDGRGQLLSLVSHVIQPISLTTVVPAVSADVVTEADLAIFRRQGQPESHTVELIVLAMPEWSAETRLAWLVRVLGERCHQPSWMHYFHDAGNGQLLRKYEGQESAAPFVECEPR